MQNLNNFLIFNFVCPLNIETLAGYVIYVTTIIHITTEILTIVVTVISMGSGVDPEGSQNLWQSVKNH